ncbi:hypothetical protein EXIGLDRAFT_730588 [Exidia glandulosa HHB12029]|uniref:Uncharacterized protein n=1 Tax=Exidia glandulosa HHB12029 TaxID=1314781 RepID=A0A165C4G8_EXIGL|nr:hypothetical protein EXIGLDRAFT_730588 [Exidia glandulosa HHB12029]
MYTYPPTTFGAPNRHPSSMPFLTAPASYMLVSKATHSALSVLVHIVPTLLGPLGDVVLSHCTDADHNRRSSGVDVENGVFDR